MDNYNLGFINNSALGGPGYLWQPNHGVKSSLIVDTWGSYLHPSYTAKF